MLFGLFLFTFTKTIDKPSMSMVTRWATNHSFNGNGSIVKKHWKNHWYQWLRSEKPLKNHWHQLFTCKKTIGKPLTTMAFLVKTITIPLWSKFYHRSALTKTKSAVLPTSLMSFCTCLEHFNLTNKEIQDEYLLHKISHIRLQTIF